MPSCEKQKVSERATTTLQGTSNTQKEVRNVQPIAQSSQISPTFTHCATRWYAIAITLNRVGGHTCMLGGVVIVHVYPLQLKAGKNVR